MYVCICEYMYTYVCMCVCIYTHTYTHTHIYINGLPRCTQMIKNPPAMQETQVQSLSWEVPLEKGMATYSSILAWRIPGTDEPGRLQSMGFQRVGQSWEANTFIFTFHTHKHSGVLLSHKKRMKSCYLQQYGWTLRILCLANKSKTATIACHSYVESKKQPTTTTKKTSS